MPSRQARSQDAESAWPAAAAAFRVEIFARADGTQTPAIASAAIASGADRDDSLEIILNVLSRDEMRRGRAIAFICRANIREDTALRRTTAIARRKSG